MGGNLRNGDQPILHYSLWGALVSGKLDEKQFAILFVRGPNYSEGFTTIGADQFSL